MRQIITIILISFLVFEISYGQDNSVELSPEAHELNKKASEKIVSQDYESALKLLDKALQTDPDFYLAHINKAFVYGELGEIDKAFLEAVKLTDLNPHFAHGWNLLGSLYDKKGNITNAIESYNKCIETCDSLLNSSENENDKDVYRLEKVYALLNLGHIDKAKEETKKFKVGSNNRNYLEQLFELGDDALMKMIKNM